MSLILKERLEIKLKEIIELLLVKSDKITDQSLMGERGGITLLLLYAAKYFNNPSYQQKGIDNVYSLFSELSLSTNYIGTYCYGLAGVGWVINKLCEDEFLDADVNNILEDIDSYIMTNIEKSIKDGNFDFLHGAVGMCYYLTDRKNNKKIDLFLNSVTDKIIAHAVEDNVGIRWIQIPLSTEDNNKRIYNLSLSHGLSGIIILLSKLYKRNIKQDMLEKYIDGAVQYLMYCKSPTYSTSLFPNRIVEEEKHEFNSRLAWCYGDLGNAISLLHAANILGNNTWYQYAIDIALYTVKRKDIEQEHVFDTCLCHGTAGLALIYLKFYKNTKRKEFMDASTYWYKHTLNMANNIDGLAGFKFNDGESWINDYSLLSGVSGVGLSLLSFLEQDVTWDECLLIP